MKKLKKLTLYDVFVTVKHPDEAKAFEAQCRVGLDYFPEPNLEKIVEDAYRRTYREGTRVIVTRVETVMTTSLGGQEKNVFLVRDEADKQ